MITLNNIESVSPILLTLLLIAYLILTELGDKKIRKTLIPFIIAFTAIFLVIAAVDVISKLN